MAGFCRKRRTYAQCLSGRIPKLRTVHEPQQRESSPFMTPTARIAFPGSVFPATIEALELLLASKDPRARIQAKEMTGWDRRLSLIVRL